MIKTTDLEEVSRFWQLLSSQADEMLSLQQALLGDLTNMDSYSLLIPESEVKLEFDGDLGEIAYFWADTGEYIFSAPLEGWIEADSVEEWKHFLPKGVNVSDLPSSDDVLQYLESQYQYKEALSQLVYSTQASSTLTADQVKAILTTASSSGSQYTQDLYKAICSMPTDPEGKLISSGVLTCVSEILDSAARAYSRAEGDMPVLDKTAPSTPYGVLGSIARGILKGLGQMLAIVGAGLLKVVGVAITAVTALVDVWKENVAVCEADPSATNRLIRGNFMANDKGKVASVYGELGPCNLIRSGPLVTYAWNMSKATENIGPGTPIAFNSFLEVNTSWYQMKEEVFPRIRELFMRGSRVHFDALANTPEAGETTVRFYSRGSDVVSLAEVLGGIIDDYRFDPLSEAGVGVQPYRIVENIIATLFTMFVGHSSLGPIGSSWDISYTGVDVNLPYNTLPLDDKDPATNAGARNITAAFVFDCFHSIYLGRLDPLQRWCTTESVIQILRALHTLWNYTSDRNTLANGFTSNYAFVYRFGSEKKSWYGKLTIVHPHYSDRFIANNSQGLVLYTTDHCLAHVCQVPYPPSARCYVIPDVSPSEVLNVILTVVASVAAAYLAYRAIKPRVSLWASKRLATRQSKVDQLYERRNDSPADYKAYAKAVRKYNRTASLAGVPPINPLTGGKALVVPVATGTDQSGYGLSDNSEVTIQDLVALISMTTPE